MVLNAEMLERAGINIDPEEFARIVLQAVEEVAPPRVAAPGEGLTEDQIEALRRGGIDPLTTPVDLSGPAGPVARGVALYAAMLATSLSVPEVARRLGVDESRVRQRIHARTMYAVKPGATWRVPIFQFAGDGLLPGIERVLPRLDPNLSPLTVVAWFRRSSSSLVTPDGRAWSPSDWLLTGYPVEQVAEAAASAGVGV
jgi:excisionase family DNA binding protein